MTSELDIRHIDRRTVDRYLRKGELSEKDYEKYLKQLPDLADKAELLPLEQPTTYVPTR